MKRDSVTLVSYDEEPSRSVLGAIRVHKIVHTRFHDVHIHAFEFKSPWLLKAIRNKKRPPWSWSLPGEKR